MSNRTLKLPEVIRSGTFLLVCSGETYFTQIVSGERLLQQILKEIYGDKIEKADRAMWRGSVYDLDQWILDAEMGAIEWDCGVGETGRIRALRITHARKEDSKFKI